MGFSRPSRWVRNVAVLALAVGAWAIISDCAPRYQTKRSTAQPLALSKPLIDFGHGAGGFSLLGKTLPHSPEALAQQLTAAYAQRADLPTSRPVVQVSGKYPHLDRLDIDLTGARLKPDYKPTETKSSAKPEPALTVHQLSYVARPLYYQQGQTNLTFSAKDVKLALLQSRKDRAVLVMTEAHDGLVDFSISQDDVQRVVYSSAKENAGKAAFFITGVTTHLSSDGPHSISIDLTVDGWWLLLPTTIHFTGRCDVDDSFNAHLSHLTCTGSNVGGPLLAAIVDGVIKKYEGKVQPLAAFPGQKIRIRNLDIHLDDDLHVKIAFGS
jgi:hypothetical protein